MRELKITPAALADVQEGMDFYNSRQAGLGDRFEEVLTTYFQSIAERPESGIIHKEIVRYRVVKHFPYLIFYQFDDEVVAVLRVFNAYQHPDKARL